MRLVGRQAASAPVAAELSPEVIRGAQRGDRAAQAEVLRRYAGVLTNLARRLAPRSDTEELTQALLQRLLAVLPRFEVNGPATLTTWVFTVAHRHIIDEHRRRRLTLVPLEEAGRVPDDAEDPHAAAWRTEVRTALEAAIAALPDDQRRVFVLAQVHEQPLEAVAEAEGIPIGTVKSRLFRARAVLAARLGPQLGQGGSHAQR